MNNVSQRVQAATKLLEYLAVKGISACICGGYARDAIFGKEIRDVDLYVYEADYDRTALELFGAVPLVEPTDSSAEYMHQSVTRQQEQSLADNTFGLETSLVNLIGLAEHTPPQCALVMEKYNLGICKAGIDYMRGLQVTDDFRSDFKDKQITLLRTDWGHEATLKQFIKLQAKYPWPLRVKPVEDFNAI